MSESRTPEPMSERRRTYMRLIAEVGVSIVGVVALALLGGPVVGILMPFILAFIMAWMFNPVIAWLQRHLRLTRRLFSYILVLVFYALLFGLCLFFAGQLISQAIDLARSVPGFIADLQGLYNELITWLQEVLSRLPAEYASVGGEIFSLLNSAWEWLKTLLSGALGYVMSSSRNVALEVPNFVIFLTVLVLAIVAGWAMTDTGQQALAQANAELDQARQAAVDALKLAESANVSKTAFLTNMSHDIRTPMNAIIGLTNLMQHDLNNPEKLQAYIDKLHTSSEHLLGLINDVLDMSKIESGAVTLRMDEVNLAEQIEQIEAIIRPQTRQRGQHFIVRASQIHHENFIGDATRLRQVLLNILSNAVKYTQQGGEISLDVREVSRSGHSYVKYAFVVKDNGIGMTEEFQKHLFDVFTRAEDSVTNKVQGTGLGMAISKSIVDMMGGVINVESAPGEGSRFEVLLEFKVDAQADDRAHTVKDCRLLLVGYAPGRVADVQDALEHTPVTAEAVERPEDAVSILRQEDVDVVLLSCQYRAPEMLRPLVRQMREAAGKPIFVFCMQAGQREEVLDIISACGLDGFVPLPFFLSNLENEMAKLRTEFGNIGNVDGTSVLNGMRLLCAEDNPLNAEILEELLHMQGATCTIYSDGKQLVEAFDHVRPSDYDVILMDVQMPGMDGYEATRTIRSGANPLGRTIPIIAMTANAFAEDIQQSMDAGMDMHLSKPIDIAVLEKTLSLFRTDKKNHGRAVFKRRVMEMEK